MYIADPGKEATGRKSYFMFERSRNIQRAALLTAAVAFAGAAVPYVKDNYFTPVESKPSAHENAFSYSSQTGAVAVVVVLGKGAGIEEYVVKLAEFQRMLSEQGIPSQIFIEKSLQPTTYAYAVVNGATLYQAGKKSGYGIDDLTTLMVHDVTNAFGKKLAQDKKTGGLVIPAPENS